MLKQVDKVTITGDNSATCDPNDDFKFDSGKEAWVLFLERLAVKLRLHLFVRPSDPIYGTSIHFNCSNIATKVYLLPQIDNSAFQTTFTDTENTYKSVVEQWDNIALPTAFTKPTGYSVFGPKKDNTNPAVPAAPASNVIILPENYLAGANNKAGKGVLLTITDGATGTVSRTGRLSIDTDDWSLTRNTFLDIAATVKQQEADIVFHVNVVDWEDDQIDTGDLH